MTLKLNRSLEMFLWIGLVLAFQGCAAEPAQVSTTNQNGPNSEGTAIASYMDQLKESDFAGAILVAQKGEVIYQAGIGLADVDDQVAITPQTVFDIGSLSKQFTAAAILHLEQQGKLSVDDTLDMYFAEIPADKAEITLHQLLTHSAGLPPYVYAGDFVETSRDEAQKLALEAELEFEPSSEYLYSDTGYGLLATIIEIVSGQSFPDYLHQNLFDPAGMVQTGFYNDAKWLELTVANGYNNGQDFGSAATRPGPYWGLIGFGGVLSTTGDLYLWSQALAENKILSAASREKLFTPYVQEYDDGPSFYGYGWVIEPLPTEAEQTLIWHDGATDSQNAIMLIAPDFDQTVIIVLSNKIDESLFSENFYGIDAGFEILGLLLDA
ncbi:MAG: serine hydrolase domain-containing protein [Anaerolineae bacterium]